MTVTNLWEGAALREQRADTRKLGKFILNLETRLEAAERRVEQHALTIEQCRQEVASRSAILKRRLSGLERLVNFLADILVAVIAVVAGGVSAAYLGSNQLLPSLVVAAVSFGLVFLGTRFLFKQVEGWCFEYKQPAADKAMAAASANRFIHPFRAKVRREIVRDSNSVKI
jgi:hypothetical protein